MVASQNDWDDVIDGVCARLAGEVADAASREDDPSVSVVIAGPVFEQNCNMNDTAAAAYAHRHTIAHRLDRVRELTGLDCARTAHGGP